MSTHQVKPGDTLSKITASNHVTLKQLLAANPSLAAHPDKINIGDPVKIPTPVFQPVGNASKPVMMCMIPATAPKTTAPPDSLSAGLSKNGIKGPQAQENAKEVLQALKDAGITSKKAQANILAQINAESGFMPRSEGKYKAQTLLDLYGPDQKGTKNRVRFQSLADAQATVDAGPEAVYDKIYGGRMSNNEPGDAYAYRGRGYIQLTGKDNYQRIGDAIGEDLVSNPDLTNDPKVATKILLNFLGANPQNQTDLEDIAKVNKKVGPATDPASRKTFSDSMQEYI